MCVLGLLEGVMGKMWACWRDQEWNEGGVLLEVCLDDHTWNWRSRWIPRIRLFVFDRYDVAEGVFGRSCRLAVMVSEGLGRSAIFEVGFLCGLVECFASFFVGSQYRFVGCFGYLARRACRPMYRCSFFPLMEISWYYPFSLPSLYHRFVDSRLGPCAASRRTPLRLHGRRHWPGQLKRHPSSFDYPSVSERTGVKLRVSADNGVRSR